MAIQKNDILFSIAMKAGARKGDVEALAGWLGELIHSQRNAKLGEGGHTENQILLQDVFVDLPASRDMGHSENDGQIRILKEIWNAEYVSAKLLIDSSQPSIIADMGDSPQTQTFYRGLSTREFSTVLLIGGPGQGKSTVGQLLSQWQRILLLKGNKTIGPEQRKLIEDFTKSPPIEEGLNKTRVPSIPLQINLPIFAAWLSRGENISQGKDNLALRFICSTPSAQQHGLKPEALMSLAKIFNIQIVFDGFDEVGSKNERERLVAEARLLVERFSNLGTSIKVLVTTRPQGYADEFEKIGFKLSKVYLLPLPEEEALKYAYRLINAKMRAADDRQRAIGQIDHAIAEPATKRLFSTPLQVTIITALVQQMGNAPRERWNLFQGYFDYTYRREVERGTFASTLLRDYRQNIEQMHARVGLMLQVRSEGEGGAASRMVRDELVQVISQILEEEGTPPEKQSRLIEDIATAAEDRLVFLVQPEPLQYGFEVRSLQEFFAAWSITNGSDEDLKLRLQQISTASSFKNVYLFSASKIFSSMQNHRDTWIKFICQWYENPRNDRFASAVNAGSQIALETLEEGVAHNQPKYSKILMKSAVGVLKRIPDILALRLARVATPDNFEQLEEVINDAFSREAYDGNNPASAWGALLECVNRSEKWALEIAEREYSDERWSVIKNSLDQTSSHLNPWLAAKIFGSNAVNPTDLLEFRSVDAGRSPLASALAVLRASRFSHWWQGDLPLILIDPKVEISYEYIPFEDVRWDVFSIIAHYEGHPSPETLAQVCERIWQIDLASRSEYFFRCSWPLLCCMHAASSKDDFLEIASQLRRGHLGNLSDWVKAQSGWKSGDAHTEALVAATRIGQPWQTEDLDASPNLYAFPYLPFTQGALPKGRVPNAINGVNELFLTSKNGAFRENCADVLLRLLTLLPKSAKIQRWPIEEWAHTAARPALSLLHRPPILSKKQWSDLLATLVNRPAQYLGAFDAIVHAVIASEGELPVIQLCSKALSRVIDIDELIAIKDDVNFEQALAYVLSNADYLDQTDLLVWRTVGEIRNGFVDLRKLDPADLQVLPESILNIIVRAESELTQQGVEDLCLHLLAIRPNLVLSSSFKKTLQIVFARRLSLLNESSTWTKLHLPLPNLDGVDDAKQSRMPGSVKIARLEIHNILGIPLLDKAFENNESRCGQLVVLIGENGVGKSTILRALALGLRNISDLSIWPANVFSGSWRSSASSLSRDSAKITITLSDGRVVDTTITHTGAFKQAASSAAFANLNLVAYGCYRGSALGGPLSHVVLGDEGGPGIATLFDTSANLIHAESWLIQLEARSLKESGRSHIFSIVTKALCKLLGVPSLYINEGRLVASLESGEIFGFSSLSDGYLSMSGWFIDLIARWLDLAERRGWEIQEHFLEKISFIVLIDEIDIHIHPAWQLDVLVRVRQILPSCTFVVTTHNPLTLAGARPEEIILLQRGKDNELMVTSGVMPPMLLTGGQLYKQYFGIDQVLPSAFARSVGRQLTLAAKESKTEPEKLELAALNIELGLGEWVIEDDSSSSPK